MNLARAVYFDADIIMLDDPLSAVDAHVSKYLFNHCICEKLRNKTRILVTHQLQYVSSCDTVIFLEVGGTQQNSVQWTLCVWLAFAHFSHFFFFFLFSLSLSLAERAHHGVRILPTIDERQGKILHAYEHLCGRLDKTLDTPRL